MESLNLYPLKFDNKYIKKIWGGRDFELFRENLPKGDIGETIDIMCHDEGISKVTNGIFAGTDLEKLMKKFGAELLGDNMPKTYFPLMVRLVSPRDKLSIQVHPDDKYAQSKGMRQGKTEAWYVMETFENPFLYVGIDKISKNDFMESLEKGDIENYMKKQRVKRGDVFLIEPGQIHAMGSNLMVVEVGTNSNTTYRFFDYGRGRDVDLNDALNVLNLSAPVKKPSGIKIDHPGFSRTIYFVHKDFAWELFDIGTFMSTETDKDRFEIYTCVEGHGIITYEHGTEYIKYGESVLMPAYLGKYLVMGKLKLLKSYIPEIDKVLDGVMEIIRT